MFPGVARHVADLLRPLVAGGHHPQLNEQCHCQRHLADGLLDIAAFRVETGGREGADLGDGVEVEVLVYEALQQLEDTHQSGGLQVLVPHALAHVWVTRCHKYTE